MAWQENLNTYCIAFMEPSERKSAVGTAMIKPINKYEANWNRTNAANIEFSKTQKNILERRLKSLEDQAAKGKVEHLKYAKHRMNWQPLKKRKNSSCIPMM